jgi:hypothetical protein
LCTNVLFVKSQFHFSIGIRAGPLYLAFIS